MRVVTETFQRYRVSARFVWNFFFKFDEDLADWDGHDQFNKIKEILFEALVIRKLSLEAQGARFLVVPKIESGIPVKIEQLREGDPNHYWDHPISILRPTDAVLRFVDYFDWDPIGCLDFRYILVQFSEFHEHIDLVGRRALLEADHVDIVTDVE